MKKINNDNLKKIRGGAVNWGMLAGVGAFVSFVVGLVDGYIHPKKCN